MNALFLSGEGAGTRDRMILVSVEGLPGTCREEVAQLVFHHAQKASGQKAVAFLPYTPPPVHGDGGGFEFLLSRALALKHVQDADVVVDQASWIDKAPTGAYPLYTGLAKALRKRLGLDDGVHRMVCVQSDPQEAFEGVIRSGSAARDVSLRDTVLPLHRLLRECATGTGHPPGFYDRVEIQAIDSARFSRDSLNALADLARAVTAKAGLA
jgi:hypothetical protein